MNPILLVCTCGAIVKRKPCAECRRRDNRRRAAKSRAHGLHTRGWTLLRRTVLQRDNYRCQLQLDGCTGRATTVHLNPQLKGDHHVATPGDCLSACPTCHGTVDGARARQ